MQVKSYCFEHSTFSKMETCWIFQLTGDKFQECLQDTNSQTKTIVLCNKSCNCYNHINDWSIIRYCYILLDTTNLTLIDIKFRKTSITSLRPNPKLCEASLISGHGIYEPMSSMIHIEDILRHKFRQCHDHSQDVTSQSAVFLPSFSLPLADDSVVPTC